MRYPFTGWDRNPRALFDAQQWPECLHATIQAYSVAGDAAATQAAVEDTGLIHELAHLASGVECNTHDHDHAIIRAELVRVLGAVDSVVDQNEDEDNDTERCESGDPECGPVEFHDVEGVPLCRVCWEGLLIDSAPSQELEP